MVSIGYTLSPEAKYPADLIEVEHILCNVTDLPGSMFREGMRLAAAGDSVGANLLGGTMHWIAEQRITDHRHSLHLSRHRH